MKFVQLAKSIEAEGLAPVYLVEGNETYFRDHAVGAIRKACALSNPVLNDVRYEGENLKGESVASFAADLRTMPFFDEKRLVRVYEFYPTERDWAKELESYVASPCPTTVLVIVNAGAKKGVDLKRKKGIVFVDCAKLDRDREGTLPRWVTGAVRRAGLAIDGDAVSLLIGYCNSDVARMKLEIDKLACLLQAGGRITRETVAAYVAKDTEYKMYELTDAVARGNASSFTEILFDLLEKGSDENAALASLVSFYRSLVDIDASRETDARLSGILGLQPFVVTRRREALRRLGSGRAKELYLGLYGLGASMRSGQCLKSGALSAAICKIFFG